MTIKLQDIYGLGKVDIIPAGGTTGQILSKQSATDGDVQWADASGTIDNFDAASTYAANDVVLQNGDLYRAKSAITPGPFNLTDWDCITSVVTAPITGVPISGNIQGGRVEYKNATTVSVHPFIMRSSDGLEDIILRTQTDVTMPGIAANKRYYLFAVINGGTHGVVVDTDINGANLPATVTAKRYFMYVTTDGSKHIIEFVNFENEVSFTAGNGIRISGGGTTAPQHHNVANRLPANKMFYKYGVVVYGHNSTKYVTTIQNRNLSGGVTTGVQIATNWGGNCDSVIGYEYLRNDGNVWYTCGAFNDLYLKSVSIIR